MVAGLETPTDGHDHAGRRGHHLRQALPAPGQHGLPELRALPAPRHLRERRLRPAAAQGQGRRDARCARCSSSSSSASQARKKPAQLSGGQQQRVALARALINEPEVLLLDEPLGALDLKLRRSMQIELKRIQIEVGLTFIHVTHDQEEAMTMADTVAVMNAGIIEQMGAPERALREPAQHLRRQLPRPVEPDRGHGAAAAPPTSSPSTCTASPVSVPADRAHADGDRGWVGIRPEKVLIGEEGEELDAPGNTIPGGVVTDVSFVGVSTQYLVRMPWGQELQVFEQNTGRRRLFRQGEQVELSWRPEYAFLLDHSQDASAGAQRGRARERDDVRTPRAAPATCCCSRQRCGWRVFFVVPFYSLVATSLYDPSGSDFRGYEMTYALGNYVDALQAYWQPLVRSLVYGGIATLLLPRARLRARLRDRLQGRALEEPDAGAGHRAVLHQLPGAHPVVEADPGRRRLDREHPAVPAPAGRRRPAARHPDRGGRRAHLQLPAVHGAAALRQHRQDRPPADRGVQRPLREPGRRASSR